MSQQEFIKLDREIRGNLEVFHIISPPPDSARDDNCGSLPTCTDVFHFTNCALYPYINPLVLRCYVQEAEIWVVLAYI